MVATITARIGLLAATLAGAMFCETLICEPAQAVTDLGTAFENTNSTSFYASLELFNGSTLVDTVSTGGLQGWVANMTTTPPNLGGNIGANTSYTAGAYPSNPSILLADYFGFDLARDKGVTITSAKLVIYTGTITSNLSFNLFAATSLYNALTNPSQQGSQYANLINGTKYGTFQIVKFTPNPKPLQLMFTLNEAAVADLNTQLQLGGKFVVAGDVSAPVPEPSTWIMILAGFAGLGLIARRRAARRRTAAATD